MKCPAYVNYFKALKSPKSVVLVTVVLTDRLTYNVLGACKPHIIVYILFI